MLHFQEFYHTLKVWPTNYFPQINVHQKIFVCFSLQETLFAILVEIIERAMAHIESKDVLMDVSFTTYKLYINIDK